MSWRNNPNPTIKPPFGSYIDWGHSLAGGLVRCWIFNEHCGLLVNNLSSYQNNGEVLGGASWGEGLKLNGLDAYVNCGNDASLNITNAITLEILVKYKGIPNDTSQQDWMALFMKGSFSSTPYGFMQNVATDSKTLNFYINGKTAASYDFSDIQNNKWYHIICTYNRSKAEIYINGIKEISADKTGFINTNATTLKIGNEGNQYYLNGFVGKASIYNRILLPDEIEWINAEPYCHIIWPSHRKIFDYRQFNK